MTAQALCLKKKVGKKDRVGPCSSLFHHFPAGDLWSRLQFWDFMNAVSEPLPVSLIYYGMLLFVKPRSLYKVRVDIHVQLSKLNMCEQTIYRYISRVTNTQ